MKKLSALLTAVALALPTVAMADPDHRWRDRDDRYDRYDRHGDYDRHVDEGRGDRIPRDRWQALSTGLRLEGRNAIRIPLHARLHAIELQAMRGGAYIHNVAIIYWDNNQRTVREERPLDARNAPNMRVELGPEGMDGIQAIVVDGQGDVRFRVIGG